MSDKKVCKHPKAKLEKVNNNKHLKQCTQCGMFIKK